MSTNTNTDPRRGKPTEPDTNAPPLCACIQWARDADDTLREHHPHCPQGNVVGFYVAILQHRDDTMRGLLLQQFIEKNFPTAYRLLTGEEPTP